MVKRKFSPGSEWLYFKIYCGVKTSDIILQESVIPLITGLKKENLIDKWFFIRYYDPKSHLRLRFHSSDLSKVEKVIQAANSQFKNFVESGEIIKIEVDTYNRELERYGETAIELAESLFWRSSELLLHFLDYEDEEKIIVSLFYLEQVLLALRLSTIEKMAWISQSNTAFRKEFNTDKKLNSQLKRKFLEFKPKYQAFVDSKEFEEIRDLIISNISDSEDILKELLKYEQEFLASFFQSIFHMHVNRAFTSNQRLFEMVIYDYLCRYNRIYKLQ